MKKVLLLLISAIIAAGFAACAAPSDRKDPSGSVAEYDVSLPDQTYDGYEFRILCRPEGGTETTVWKDDIFADDTGTRVGSAVQRRNAWVCDTLDVKLTYSLSSDSNMETDAMPSLMSGLDDYDLIMPHGRSATTYADSGLLTDWNDLRWVDLDMPWWDHDARDTFSINHKLYIMNGDISYMSVGYTFAMYFNKDIMDDIGMEYPYELVKSGEWTFDRFAVMARQGTMDLDGDGLITAGTDRFGYSTHEHGASFQVMFSSGSRLILKDGDDLPYCPGVNELAESSFEKFYALIDSQDGFMYFNSKPKFSVSSKNQECLFWDTYVNGLQTMGDYSFDYGIVPWPNFQEGADGYSCHVSVYVHQFIVPGTITDRDKIGAITEALCYGGYRYVIDEYYEQTLQFQKSRDEQSIEMLKLIRDSRAYDLGFFEVSLEPLSSLGNTLANLPTHNMTTFFNKYQGQINQKIDKLIGLYID